MQTEITSLNQREACPTGQASFYRPELDILRFFAFLAVYVSHSLRHDPAQLMKSRIPEKTALLLAAIASSGRFGVQLFFLLSAYLITSLLLREKEVTGHINLRAFYVRRILRIWPLYFFVLTVAVLWPWSGRLPIGYFVGFLLLAGNWMVVLFGAADSWAIILWSVSIEEQFYLVWPLGMKFLSRRGWLYTALGLIATANLVRAYLALGLRLGPQVWCNTFAQLDCIGAGILCAVLLRGSVPRFSVPARALLASLGILVLVACGYYAEAFSPRFAFVGLAFVTTGCWAVFLSVCGSSLSLSPLVYLGKISYGLYVYHVLAISLVGRALGTTTGRPLRYATLWWGSLLLTIAMASASYRWLETPFLRLKERFTCVQSRPV